MPPSQAIADEAPDTATLARALQQLSPDVYSKADRERLAGMARESSSPAVHEANRLSSEAWQSIKTRDDWERFRAPRLAALRASLGQFPEPPKKLNWRVTGRVAGGEYRIENLVFESRPGLWVTANLYRPAKPRPSMPGILICHSHHNPKTQGELQDMGMTWARAGCLVLVHRPARPRRAAAAPVRDRRGLRRAVHASAGRITTSATTSACSCTLVGDSLIGWMAWDLMRGVDLLLAQPGIDKDRIILLGAVAGGGDPAAVTAALDPRIAAVVPFNFGGPQPETSYPLPDDAETSRSTTPAAGAGNRRATCGCSAARRLPAVGDRRRASPRGG